MSQLIFSEHGRLNNFQLFTKLGWWLVSIGASVTIEKLVFFHKWLLFAGSGWRLFTGEVVFQWCEQMPDDRDAPGATQEFLSGTPTHVGHVCVVDGEAKDPAGEEIHQNHYNQSDVNLYHQGSFKINGSYLMLKAERDNSHQNYLDNQQN